MKRWNVLNKIDFKNTKNIDEKIFKILLENRGITSKKTIQEFLSPKLEQVTIASVGIDKKQLKKAMDRVYTAIKNNEQIIIYGDYDVDGITGTAILWETLHNIGANVLPYIPDRIEEGYGLSAAGISKIKPCLPAGRDQRLKTNKVKLIITVDNGIVANDAVKFANKQGIDVIITDHHIIGSKLPDAFAIVHTTRMCGAGIAWLLSRQFKKKSDEYNIDNDEHLGLAALGTVADMVPLIGDNRTIVKFGLEKIKQTRRPGLLELCKQAGIEIKKIGVYEVGFMIAPRLNASGRIESAMDSLRLLCTTNKDKARALAEKLEITNRERQSLMKEASEHAKEKVKSQKSKVKNLLFVAHESYQQGVIGLVAGKLVEEFYRPSIVVSIGEKYSKASARSVSGFNIIQFLRSSSEYFVNVGGHPMAAGFTIETEKIIFLKEFLETEAEKLINRETLTKSLKIDCELPQSAITKNLFMSIRQLEPFGMENPQPVFTTRDMVVDDTRVLGKDGKHFKIQIRPHTPEILHIKSESLEAIAFNMGELAGDLKIGTKIDIAYTIDENTWNGNTKLQLKIKDIKITN